MQNTSAGHKHVPIDVDELFDGVEEVVAPHPVSERYRPVRSRRLRKPAPGSSSQHPIALDCDAEEGSTTIANPVPMYPIASSSLNTSRNGRVAGQTPSRTSQAQQRQVGASRDGGLSTPLSNMRLQGLVAPSPSPPRNLAGHECPSAGPLEDIKPFYDLPKDPSIKMDIDSAADILSAEGRGDVSSSDDSWEWSDLMQSDEDQDLDDHIDIREALKQKFGDESGLHSSTSSAREQCKSRLMLKAETATVRIPLRRNKLKHRIWDIPRTKIHRLHTPLTTDYRQILRPKTGVLMHRTHLQQYNVFNCWLNIPLPKLRTPHYKELRASASVNKIVQSHEFIAVASPAKGGDSDSETSPRPPEVDAYNREGNLIVWWRDKYLLLDVHSRSWPMPEGSLLPSTKYYSVSDVAFDPLRPNRLVSSGRDRRVNVVDLQICQDTFVPRDVCTFKYTKVPYDISFRPRSSLFAVSCYDGCIYMHNDNTKFALKASDGRDSRPGAFIWGASSLNPRLDNILFASTESDKDDVCWHTAFDVEKQCEEYELDINDSSDAMALDPQGRTLALVTSRSSNSSYAHSSYALSLFDVSHNNGARVAGTRLHALRPDTRPNPRVPLETTHAAFSPDGILLALARNDHRTHVYDVRFLSEKPMAEFVHPPVERPRNEHEEYGVTGLRWVEGWNGCRTARGGLGLVTSGADDCVRLWDVMRGPTHQDESMVLAKVDMDVACFSVGDISKNEHRLVVGDCAGEVYIFD